MLKKKGLQTGLLLLASSLALAFLALAWRTLTPPVVLRETKYQVVWTDNFRSRITYNVVVWQRNKNRHNLSVTAKKIVLDTIQQRRKAKKPMPLSMQIFFHYSNPIEQQSPLNTDVRARWSTLEGIKFDS
jgi:hypothetical protein